MTTDKPREDLSRMATTYTDAQISRAIRQAHGDADKAASQLGCSASTVYRRGRRLGLEVSSPSSPAKATAKRKAESGKRKSIEDGPLWERYQAGEREAADEIARKYLPLVRVIVGRLAAKLPESIDRDGLLSAGLVGLLDAMRRFDPARGLAFRTFAPTRIRGEILDELRSGDHESRKTREMARRYAAASDRLLARHGREPTRDEVLAELCWSWTEAMRWEVRNVKSLETLCYETDSGKAMRLGDLTPAPAVRDRRAIAEIEHITQGLPFEPRVLLWLYFALGHTMRDIGEIVRTNESRVSQMISNALKELRRIMEEHANG